MALTKRDKELIEKRIKWREYQPVTHWTAGLSKHEKDRIYRLTDEFCEATGDWDVDWVLRQMLKF